MASIRIQPIGAYLQADEHGVLPARAPGNALEEPWASPVERLVERYLNEWGSELHSIYLRGSVPRGLAIPDVSDIDSFAVLDSRASGSGSGGRLENWTESVDVEFRNRFPFVAGVEADLVPLEAVLDRSNVYSFTMKTESTCVHGESLSSQLKPFSLKEADFQTRYFGQHLELFVNEFPDEPAAERPGFVAWIAKRFLRLGMELVMMRENRYTRDLYLCYESFATHYPEHAEAMYRALELAVEPVATEEVESFLQGFGGWLAGEAQRALNQLSG